MTMNIPAERPDTHLIEAHARELRSQETVRVARAVARSIANGFRSLSASFADARRMQRAYAELIALSDKELRDIGMTRSDIPAAIAGTLRRDVELTSIEGSQTTKAAPAAAANDETIRLAA
jgi:uncharacterized protein YjiS (DUF1127 family)